MSSAIYNDKFQARFRTVLKDAGVNLKTFCADAGLGYSTVKLLKSGGQCSEYTKNRIVEVLNTKLRARSKAQIQQSWLFEQWQARQRSSPLPSVVQINDLKHTHSPQFRSKTEIIDLPDLLTPGTPEKQFTEIYTKHVGAKLANILSVHSRATITAVEDGDFEAQTFLGLRIADEAGDFPGIKGVGLYFAGEGLRLQGDMQGDSSKKANLYEQARSKYNQASGLIPLDPRPVRGIARIDEHEERLDDAENGFYMAEGLVLCNNLQRGIVHKKSFLNHEHLRVVRHKIHCLLDLRESSPNNIWNQEHKFHELHGFVVHCDNLHSELMGSFQAQQRWWQIEWFMGLVFLAKAWGKLKQPDRTHLCLLHALSVRRQMLANSKKITQVERANFEWWIGVALLSKEHLTSRFTASVEKLQLTLFQKNDADAIAQIDNIVRPIQSPGTPVFEAGFQPVSVSA